MMPDVLLVKTRKCHQPAFTITIVEWLTTRHLGNAGRAVMIVRIYESSANVFGDFITNM